MVHDGAGYPRSKQDKLSIKRALTLLYCWWGSGVPSGESLPNRAMHEATEGRAENDAYT